MRETKDRLAVECTSKHTRYQPDMSEWKCPKCGSKDFYIDEPAEDASEKCDLLHDEDILICQRCVDVVQHTGWKDYDGISGRKWSSHLIKKSSMVPCPTCHGKGYVKGGKDAKKADK